MGTQIQNTTIKAKKEVVLEKDAYGDYKISGKVGSQHTLDPDLAERMIQSGHARICETPIVYPVKFIK